MRDKVRRQTNERREDTALRQRKSKEPSTFTARPLTRRKRELPELPELGGEIGATQVGITT